MSFYLLFLNDIKIFYPEIFISFSCLSLLLYGVFIATSKKFNYPNIMSNVHYYSLLVLIITFVLLNNNLMENSNCFLNIFVYNDLIFYSKNFILLFIFCCLIIFKTYVKNYKINNFEYYVLILFTVLSLNLIISSNDFISLYLSIEMQALIFYILASFKKDSVYSTEAGLKYFILGAFSSGLLLFSFSLVYGIMGTTNLTDMYNLSLDVNYVGFDVIKLAIIFLISTFLFKIGSFPFHMWVPDVYEGSPTSTTLFFSVVPKLALIVIVLRLVNYPFSNFNSVWSTIFLFSGLLSILISSFVAYKQESLKRLLSYSGIGHVGFILLAISSNSPKAALFYSIIYVIPSLIIWGGLINCLQSSKKQSQATISTLSGLSVVNPYLGLIVSLSLFSLAGIPPLVGFSGKAFVLFSVIFNENYFIAVVSVIASTISSVYYISIIKTIYFEKNKNWVFYKEINKNSSVVLSVCSVLLLFLFFEPNLLLLINEKMSLDLIY